MRSRGSSRTVGLYLHTFVCTTRSGKERVKEIGWLSEKTVGSIVAVLTIGLPGIRIGSQFLSTCRGDGSCRYNPSLRGEVSSRCNMGQVKIHASNRAVHAGA